MEVNQKTVMEFITKNRNVIIAAVGGALIAGIFVSCGRHDQQPQVVYAPPPPQYQPQYQQPAPAPVQAPVQAPAPAQAAAQSDHAGTAMVAGAVLGAVAATALADRNSRQAPPRQETAQVTQVYNQQQPVTNTLAPQPEKRVAPVPAPVPVAKSWLNNVQAPSVAPAKPVPEAAPVTASKTIPPLVAAPKAVPPMVAAPKPVSKSVPPLVAAPKPVSKPDYSYKAPAKPATVTYKSASTSSPTKK